MNTPPVLDRLSELATTAGQDVAAAVEEASNRAGKQAKVVRKQAKRAGNNVAAKATTVSDRVSGQTNRRASHSRRWGWLGAGLVVAAGAGALVVRRRSAATPGAPTTAPAHIEPVADPR
jgi:hypothetical protein